MIVNCVSIFTLISVRCFLPFSSFLPSFFKGIWLLCFLFFTLQLYIIGIWVSVLHFTISLHLYGYLAFLFFTSYSWAYELKGCYSSLHRALGFVLHFAVSLLLHRYMGFRIGYYSSLQRVFGFLFFTSQFHCIYMGLWAFCFLHFFFLSI